MKVVMISVLALAAMSVNASERKWESGNAVNNCRAAQTFRDVGVRSRPLALVNETNPGTYINCAFRTDKKDGSIEFRGTLQNYSDVNRTINCTGVVGVDDGDAEYFVKSVDLPANSRRGIYWRNNEGFESNVGFQCYLPAQVGLNELEILK